MGDIAGDFFAYNHLEPQLCFTPDGQSVCFISDLSGTPNVWRSELSGSSRRQITHVLAGAARGLACSPDGTLFCLFETNGNENGALCQVDAEGRVQWLKPNGVAHYDFPPHAISPDGRWLAYSATTQGEALAVSLYDIQTGKVLPLLTDGRYTVANWSPDGRKLLVTALSGGGSPLLLVDVHDGSRQEILPKRGVGFVQPGPWSPARKGFFVLTDYGREQVGVAFVVAETGESRWLYTSPDDDAEDLALSPDESTLALVVNHRGWSRLKLIRMESRELVPPPPLPDGVISGVTCSPRGNWIAFQHQCPTSPPHLYAYNYMSRELICLTTSHHQGMLTDCLAAPEAIWYPTWDGRQIHAWLYRPPGASTSSVPVFISIHGGPEAQERPTYHGLYQYLLQCGIAVLAPNIRGSLGYGKTFKELIYRDWGGGELSDIDFAFRWLRTQPWVNAKAIGIGGASFGGFAALSALTRLPYQWACGSSVNGPADLLAFARTVPAHWRAALGSWLGDPETDQDDLRSRSPSSYLDNLSCPVLVVQSDQDARITSESVRELEHHPCVQYVVVTGQGHALRQVATNRAVWTKVAQFTAQHLLRQGS